MYYYLYDTFLNDKKFDRTIDKIKEKLLELDINGKHIRLSLLKRIEEIIDDEARRGIKTLVIVGNDSSFLKVIDPVVRNGLTLGFIPVGQNNNIAPLLGIGVDDEACEAIAARKLVEVDIGDANGQFFFSNVKMSKSVNRLLIEHGNFKIMPTNSCKEVCVYNFYYPMKREEDVLPELNKIDAQDQKLNLVARSEIAGTKGILKIFSGKKEVQADTFVERDEFMVKSYEYLPLVLDNYRVIKTPAKIKIASAKLKLIVGKNRSKLLK
ncbi:MAG: diacylglycerol kinase family protein [Candidatus Falkowbacteria bacterium]